MADYKELLRRAVEALPENNGAARRAVYEKARAALVGQLRAINPPLAARDITTHRLQLEDCIRQVEQEASEAVIAGMNGSAHDAAPAPVYFEPPPSKPLPPPGRGPAKPQLNAPVQEQARLVQRGQQPGASIEDIIAAADRDAREHTPPRSNGARPEARALTKPIQLRSVPPEPMGEEPAEDDIEEPVPPRPIQGRSGARPLPAIVARAEAAKGRSASTAFNVPTGDNPGRRGPTLEGRRDGNGGIGSLGPQLGGAPTGGTIRGPQLVARHQAEPVYLDAPQQQIAAMSAVREVEVEPDPQPSDPQGLIDRAMATLDREARGETTPVQIPVQQNGFAAIDDEEEDERPARVGLGGMFPDAPRRGDGPGVKRGRNAKPPREPKGKLRNPLRDDQEERAPVGRRGREAAVAEAGFPRARAEDDRSGISAVTIFLIVFSVLLLGAGGAGVWAWNEGYLNLDSVFGNKPAAVASTETPAAAAAPVATASSETAVPTPQSGPGNTTLSEPAVAAVPEMKEGERLPSEPAPAAGSSALALAGTPVPADNAQRLGDTAAGAASSVGTDVAALNPDGSQSLLLEASDDGTTGAVPFSGTVEWTKGKDETGLPTLVGKASIPARNLGVDILIRKNVDTTLPASHLMEISFKVSDSFIGGSVAGLPGVLLKNEELVQGQPLVGASARVVGNSFLFALSSAPEDTTANSQLLTTRKWMDLAIIYATGKRAIITLEKDTAAETMFNEVFEAWGNTQPPA